jgi:MoxR-like ATPase
MFESRIDLSALNNAILQLKNQISSIVVGQENAVELICAALLAKGHILIEGAPGVAKTLTAKLLAKSVDARFSRIQFTPDLMPSDVVGTAIFNPQTLVFQYKPGPIFANMVLIDEINRAPAKTQAALFEVMEERQVSADGAVYALEAPFMILATQNPIEHEGTYRLPEAQLDRFLFKIDIPYPNVAQETQILQDALVENQHEKVKTIAPVLKKESIVAAQETLKYLLIEEKLIRYIAELVTATRSHASLSLGASPRASLAILNASRALAAIRGRDFVTPEDIQTVAFPVLRHRIQLSPEKEMEGKTADQIIQELLARIEVPR